MNGEKVDGWVTESLQGIIERMFDLLIYSGASSPVYNADRRGEGRLNLQMDQGVLQLQDVFNPLVLFLATLGILLAAIRLLWTRRLDPMLDLIRGLLTVIVVTFGGLFLIYILRQFSFGLTNMVLTTGTYGDQSSFLESAQSVYPSIMRVGVDGADLGFADNEVARGAVTSLVGLAVILGLIAQMIVLALLEAVTYLIACLLPLAAASSMIPNLKIFPKVIGWLFACFLYKPLLLMIYLVGLVVLASAGPGGDDLLRYLTGAAVMLLATGALPVLMKLMSSGSVWMMALAAGGLNSVTGGGGGGGGGGNNGGGNTAGFQSSAGSADSGTATAQQAAAGANERAAGLARNLDEGGPLPGGDAVPVAAVSAAGTGSGAAATSALGTQTGQLSGLGGTGAGGTDGAADSAGGAVGGADGGTDAAASGATESVSSTVSGSEQSYSHTTASGADEVSVGGSASGADAGGADAPGGAATAPDGGGPAAFGGGSAPAPEGASGAQFADGADGRMV
ncbi:hypothetical protein [Nocardiopsis dassonvillei]|uniref:hypothetical protein n=1 Tax=Nocardiopsis dassonvillei TaxID=2014 RepID=UPI00366A6BF7